MNLNSIGLRVRGRPFRIGAVAERGAQSVHGDRRAVRRDGGVHASRRPHGSRVHGHTADLRFAHRCARQFDHSAFFVRNEELVHFWIQM